jgi:hypothetical protein
MREYTSHARHGFPNTTLPGSASAPTTRFYAASSTCIIWSPSLGAVAASRQRVSTCDWRCLRAFLATHANEHATSTMEARFDRAWRGRRSAFLRLFPRI